MAQGLVCTITRGLYLYCTQVQFNGTGVNYILLNAFTGVNYVFLNAFPNNFLMLVIRYLDFLQKNNYIPLIPEVSIKRFYRRNLFVIILENYQLNESLILILSSWRPDGKLVAAGYSSGLLAIRHIESAQSIHTEQLDAEISWISWIDRPPGFISKVRYQQSS